ncbi:MAG: 50S ribosomal protein L6 [Candidatus Omnitrophica bacterium]|nr:50S ribosomal protein L6 [Candidatus Omnitrophota bacterium]
MSRIGRAPIAIPSSVKLIAEGQTLRVEGAKGKLSLTLPPLIHVELKEKEAHVAVEESSEKTNKMQHGLYRALIANMVRGVNEGFSKELEISGVGYRAQVSGKQLTLHVGFSHPVAVPIPEGITVELPKPTNVIIKGADRHAIGQFAANIRGIAPPEPYKGKGIKYANEIIRRKAGKAATGTGAKSTG